MWAHGGCGPLWPRTRGQRPGVERAGLSDASPGRARAGGVRPHSRRARPRVGAGGCLHGRDAGGRARDRAARSREEGHRRRRHGSVPAAHDGLRRRCRVSAVVGRAPGHGQRMPPHVAGRHGDCRRAAALRPRRRPRRARHRQRAGDGDGLRAAVEDDAGSDRHPIRRADRRPGAAPSPSDGSVDARCFSCEGPQTDFTRASEHRGQARFRWCGSGAAQPGRSGRSARLGRQQTWFPACPGDSPRVPWPVRRAISCQSTCRLQRRGRARGRGWRLRCPEPRSP